MKTAADFVVFVHRLNYDGHIKKGGLDIVVDYLVSLGYSGLLFEFPLDYSQTVNGTVSFVSNKSKIEIQRFALPSHVSVINWIIEVIYSAVYVALRVRKVPLILTADPLTTLPAVILKVFGLCKFIYFHLIDYSTDRFSNKFLNFIYDKLLILGSKRANVVGVVTQKASGNLRALGITNYFCLPNGPDFHGMDTYRVHADKREDYSLVLTCAELLPKFKILETLELISLLKPVFPQIKLRLIGYLNTKSDYGKQVIDCISTHSLTDNVVIYGHVSREENYSILANSKIGLAFYNTSHDSHIKSGDSIKLREYACLGLPAVSDGTTVTSAEMASTGSGYEVYNLQQACEKIYNLFRDPDEYERLVKNALHWAQKNDKAKLLSELYEKHIKQIFK